MWLKKKNNFEWPNIDSEVWNVSFEGTLKKVFCLLFFFFVLAREALFSRSKKSQKMQLCDPKTSGAWTEKNRRRFSIEMCPQNFHSTPENQCLTT